MNIFLAFRLVKVGIVLLIVGLISLLFGSLYFASGFIQPYFDFSSYLLPLLTMYVISTVLFSVIMYLRVKTVEPSEVVNVTQKTVVVNDQEVEIVEAEIQDLDGYKSYFQYFHNVTVTPNEDSPYSWNNIAKIVNAMTTESVCFVVDKSEQDLVASEEEFTNADTVIYPKKEYSELNSSYTELESIQFYNEEYDKIYEYKLE